MKVDEIVTILAAAGFGVGFLARCTRSMFKTREASGALVWILFCLLLPWIGAFAYVTIGDDRIIGRRRRRIGAAHARYRTGRVRAPRTRGARPLAAPRPHRQRHRRWERDGRPGRGAGRLRSNARGDRPRQGVDRAPDLHSRRRRDGRQVPRRPDRARARAGVDVRMLYDSIGSRRSRRASSSSRSATAA